MKSLICKEILGTRTLSGATFHSLQATDIPEGTKSILFTVDDNLGTAWYMELGYQYSFTLAPDSKNHFYLHRIWSNKTNANDGNIDQSNFNLTFSRNVGNFTNITVVYLR